MEGVEQSKFMKRYLLGQVSIEERAAFEDRYVANDDLFEELVELENDLIDSYVRDLLSPAERSQFEDQFLTTPSRRERVEFAKSFMPYVSPAGRLAPIQDEEAPLAVPQFIPDVFRLSTVPMRVAALGILLAVAAAGMWLWTANAQLHRDLDHIRAEKAQLKLGDDELRQQLADLKTRLQHDPLAVGQGEQTPQPGEVVVSLMLSPDLARGGPAANTLPLPRGITAAFLTLKREREEYSSYGAVLETADGSRIWQTNNVKSWPIADGARFISLRLPTKALKNGDYVMKLTGNTTSGRSEEAAAYTFRVVTR